MAQEIKIKLTIDGKESIATLDLSDEKVRKLMNNADHSFKKVTGTLKNLAGTLGLAFGLNEIVNFSKEAVMLSAELEVLRNNFQGTAADIELFRKATAGTVSEANLIKLSNQASDLGVSIEEQAQLFLLAEQSGDKYGVSLEESFKKIILVTEGNARGLKDLGIQKVVYENQVNKLAAAHGKEIKELDAVTQKQVRLQAILRASNVTMEDVNNNTADAKDRFEQFGVALEESKTNFGDFVRDAGNGWFDLITAFAQGGAAGLGVFMGINQQLDIMAKNIQSIKQMYSDAIAYAGNQAEEEIKGKSSSEIATMIRNNQAKIDALQNKARESGFDADSKNDLQQLQRKQQVYQSTLDLMNFINKEKTKSLITTDEELKEEIKIVNDALRGNISLRERILLKEKLKKLQDELNSKEEKSIANDELAKGSREITERQNKERIKDYEKELQLKREEEDIQSNISALQEEDAWSKYISNIDEQADSWEDVKRAARPTIDTLSRGLSDAVIYGRNFNDVLKNIFGTLMSMSLSGVLQGLFAMLPGGSGFLSGFLGAFGIKANYSGGIINEPVMGVGLQSKRLWSFGEKGYEMVSPLNRTITQGAASGPMNINLTLNGEFTQRGKDLYAVVNSEKKIIKRYK